MTARFQNYLKQKSKKMTNKDKKIESRSIVSSDSLLKALRQMDAQKVKMLFVFEGNSFVSILTIGDIQRAIVKNISLETPVSMVLRDTML